MGRPARAILAISMMAQLLPLAAAAQTPPQTGEPPSVEDRVVGAGKKAGEIASQPARDLNIDRKEIPPILVTAAHDPYDLAGLSTCQQLAAEVGRLNEVLGPDFVPADPAAENKGEKLAEAGGKAVVNSLIPFRGLVREVSGAAPAQRAMNAAVDAGLARRGFLRGVHRARGCRTSF
jgi:hypothetical protein